MKRLIDYLLCGSVAGFLLAAAAPGVTAQESIPTIEANHTIENVRNARYCEIIPVVRSGFHLDATVYNTLGLNDCPAGLWHEITESGLKKRFGAVRVVLNGPRYFLMDSIRANGVTAAGKTIQVGSLALIERASISLGLFDLRHEPYRERTIQRETTYAFDAGKPVFMLEAPDGSRYVMQTYAQIVDKTLSYDNLADLAPRLKLPQGWRYTTKILDKDLVLGAQGKATVVQDDLQNTYQKMD